MARAPEGPRPERPRTEVALRYWWSGYITINEARRMMGLDTMGHCACGRDRVPGARFCDLCGAPVAYTGKTERLG